MSDIAYRGILLIGDPHLEGRQPGFRCDDYPTVILEKLRWCLAYAAENALLPAILGDLFDKPRDNPNWLLVRLLETFQSEVIGIYGNHDVHYNPELTDDDSLSLLVKSGQIRLVDEQAPWAGSMNGRPVIIGGSSYRRPIPKAYELPLDMDRTTRPLVVWLTHHDVLIPGYDDGRIKPCEIAGIDLVVNGHIHRRLENVPCGGTCWVNPGSISRRSRNDATREHIPSALRIDVATESQELSYVEIPHRPFDDVFHPAIVEAVEVFESSAFVAGLAELQARRTDGGAGLKQFLQQNLKDLPPDVADEIWKLQQETSND